MSTVVLTLVVVGGSFAVAAQLVRRGERKPATEASDPHRAPRRARRQARRATAASREAAVVDAVPPKPGVFVRLRAGVVLTVIVAGIGAGIAIAIVGGAQVISRALETAVQ